MFLGYCMHEGIGDPRDMFIDQFCALVWYMLCRDFEEKDEGKKAYLKAQLWIPPKGMDNTEIDPRSPWHPDNQLSALQRAKAGN